MVLKPILKAMLLCDATLIEEGTRKRSLIGLFDRVKAGKFPVVHGTMSVYVQFREVEGTFDFLLELYDLAQDKALHRAKVEKFQVHDRSRDCELVFNLLSVRLTHPGDYEFRIFINDVIFGQKSFQVVE